MVVIEVPILSDSQQRTNRHPRSANAWLVMASILLACAVFVGSFFSTPGLILALILLAFAISALAQGIKTRTSENIRAVRKLQGGCLHCGYNLTGNESGVCPECGKAAGSDV